MVIAATINAGVQPTALYTIPLYRFFLIHFLPSVIGRIRHRLNAHSMITSDLCTVSMEAFALIVLENNWE